MFDSAVRCTSDHRAIVWHRTAKVKSIPSLEQKMHDISPSSMINGNRTKKLDRYVQISHSHYTHTHTHIKPRFAGFSFSFVSRNRAHFGNRPQNDEKFYKINNNLILIVFFIRCRCYSLFLRFFYDGGSVVLKWLYFL